MPAKDELLAIAEIAVALIGFSGLIFVFRARHVTELETRDLSALHGARREGPAVAHAPSRSRVRSGRAALEFLRGALGADPCVADVRGLGLMIGIECDRPETASRACRVALSRGIILLPSGDDGAVLSITPPLCIERDALIAALEILVECIR